MKNERNDREQNAAERLSGIRERLNGIDVEMAALFRERQRLGAEAARCKQELGKQVRDEAEEERKLSLIRQLAVTPFEAQGLSELFRQMMAISRKYQYQLRENDGTARMPFPFRRTDGLTGKGKRVVYQGVEGAYSHAAALRFFGSDAEYFHVPSFRAAQECVSEGRADYAVLPIENSSAGQVGDVYDLLLAFENSIVGEIYLPVRHCLLGLPQASINGIRRVYSHPQGLMQCQGFLNEHRDWDQISQANTAMAAMKVVEERDPGNAAIASALSARLYGLDILQEGVNDNRGNTTRFLILSSEKVYTQTAGKVSICFEIAHESGSLYNTLAHIIFNNLNMNKIESRPIPDKPFTYRFFVDFEGNLSDAAVLNALSGIAGEAERLRILGNYEEAGASQKEVADNNTAML